MTAATIALIVVGLVEVATACVLGIWWDALRHWEKLLEDNADDRGKP